MTTFAPSIVIAGGGTGGHLFPGLAVAEVLRRRGAAVSFIGTERGLEARRVPQEGYPLHLISVSGLLRVGLQARLAGLSRLPLAALQTLRLLRRLRPAVVVGVGGYASGPAVLLAALLRIPTAVLEQNSVPGRTNRVLAAVARRIFLAFPEAADHLPASARARTVLAGNPVRGGLLASAAEQDPAQGAAPRVLVLGGSQGAHAVNQLVAGALEHLQRTGATLPRLLHQSGKADAEALAARYQALAQAAGLAPGHLVVTPFIEDMGRAYAGSALVIGRAGATTLAELCAVGRPALLIPLPTATDDHQTRNAQHLVQAGAARLLPQAKTTPQDLAAALSALLQDPDRLASMAQASRTLGRPQAAEAIADQILALASRPG